MYKCCTVLYHFQAVCVFQSHVVEMTCIEAIEGMWRSRVITLQGTLLPGRREVQPMGSLPSWRYHVTNAKITRKEA